MSPDEIRLECLRLAADRGLDPADTVSAAERCLAFVEGRPARTPREAILDALEAAGVR